MNMSRSGPEILHEGWLTKSPPTNRIIRGRWRKRWFSLHCGELPGQYQLTYYTDRNCRKLKGVIDLDRCEQVDIGLKLEVKKLKFDHMFNIKTPARTYFLAAESEVEMKNWVIYICDVCNLKSSEDEELAEYLPAVNTNSQLNSSQNVNNSTLESPPISPVSTSPYIHISECVTGKSPILSTQNLRQHNIKNTFTKTSGGITTVADNSGSGHHNPPTYLNLEQYYDSPRSLQAPPCSNNTNREEVTYYNMQASPLQSPTGSDAVFTDDDWTLDKDGRNSKPSDSLSDINITSTSSRRHKLTSLELVAPPRPPKPAHIPSPKTTTTNYFNISALSEKQLTTDTDKQPLQQDDMYDFPRSHHHANSTEMVRDTLQRRHCYNNAAPGAAVATSVVATKQLEGDIFTYDLTTAAKPGTSQSCCKMEMEDGEEAPPSPLSQCCSGQNSNLPSPSIYDTTQQQQQKKRPPVNRELKPHRKLSDSYSITSSNEPPSPCLLAPAPSIDRKLKPSLPDVTQVVRAAPSPTPPGLARSHESLLSDKEDLHVPPDGDCTERKILDYLDLDLDKILPSNDKNINPQLPRSPGVNTVYKKVDFMKTEAFKLTRNNLEKERQENVPLLKK